MCFVVDGSTASVLPRKILEKMKAMQNKIYLKGMVMKQSNTCNKVITLNTCKATLRKGA